MIRSSLFFLLIFLPGHATFGQESAIDLPDFLSKYAESMKKIRSIEFDLEVKNETIQMKGKVFFDKGRVHADHRFSFVGEIITPSLTRKVGYSDNNEHYMTYQEDESLLSEGEMAQVKVYNEFGDALMSAGPPLVGAVVNSPFTNSPHYGRIREDYQVEFKGFEEIEGVRCVELLVTKGKRQQTYFVGAEDYLLRRIVTGRTMFGKGETTLSYNILSTNQKFTQEQFDLGVSTGKSYQKGGVLAVGTEAPDFRLKNLKGDWVSLSDFEGKLVLIDFWGTWCKPCLSDIPELNRLHDNMSKKDFVILGVSAHEKTEDALRLMAEKKGIRYVILEKGEEVADKYHVDSYPALVLVDTAGKIILTKGSGSEQDDMSWEALAEFIRTSY